MADLNISNGTSTGRNRGLESTSSSCTDSDLLSIFNLSQATARIEREVLSNQFAGSSNGQCCLKHLRKSLSDKISKFELLEIQSQRPSVITPTPPGSPRVIRASTPLEQIFPIPPTTSPCVSSDQIELHIPPASPTCSEISSIGGDVFPAVESLEPVLHSINTVEPVSNLNNQSSNMEQAEDLVDDTRRELEQKMRLYTVSHLDNVNVDQNLLLTSLSP